MNEQRTYNVLIRPKIESYFRESLGLKDYKNGWLKGDCPFCGRELKYGYHPEQERTNCFICGANHRPLNAIMELEDFKSHIETWRFLKTYEDAPYHYQQQVKAIERRQVILPESFTLLSLGEGQLGKLARKYMKGRGFDIDTLSLSGVGYCSSGKYLGYIIIPYYKMGNLIYYTSRKFINHDGPKIKNPPMEDFGLGKNQLIHNIDAIFVYSEIIIVESITNEFTLGENATAIGGKFLSNYQLNDFLNSNVSRYTLVYDPDAYGKSLELALKISPLVSTRVVKLPSVKLPNGSYKDVNDWGFEKSWEFINKTPFKTYSEFYKEYIDFKYERIKSTY